MTTIKITENRAILVKDNTVALAKWHISKVKIKGTYEYEIKQGWVEYRWPANMDRAVATLAQEFVSDMELIVSMKEFKETYQEVINTITAAING